MNHNAMEKYKSVMQRLNKEIEEFIDEEAKKHEIHKENILFEVFEEPIGFFYTVTLQYGGETIATKIINMNQIM